MPTTLKLYETVHDLAVVRAWVDEHADELLANGGELPPALAALLDAAEGAFTEKVERVALFIRETLATAEAVKAEATRLTQRAKTLTHTADALKAYLHRELDRAGRDKVAGTLATVALQRNSQPTVTCAVPVETLPPAFVTVPAPIQPPAVLNREAVLAAVEAGAALPEGVTCVTGRHVRIR